MPRNFEVIQLEIDEAALKSLSNRERNQIVACMHAHNELAVLNRLLGFSLNDVGEGELHDHAHGVQMWCIIQMLTGKLFETWNILYERYLKSNPEDPAIAALSEDRKIELAWLRNYFSSKETALRIIRDKSAFHYDKQLNLDDAVTEVTEDERRVYLAQHPANTLYYLGSSLVYRAVFALVADNAGGTNGMSQIEKMQKGVAIALVDVNNVNTRLHGVLYGLLWSSFSRSSRAPLAKLDQTRIQVLDAPTATMVGLPMFLNMDPSQPTQHPSERSAI
jgi:hypothetical protein